MRGSILRSSPNAMSHHPSDREIARIQSRILHALRAGASFSTCHKEGGTDLVHQNGRFVRIDFGDCPARVEFADEAAFLAALRKFFEWETTGAADELKRWQKIRRLLRKRSASVGGHSPLQWGMAFVIAAIAVGVLHSLRGGPFWFHRPSTTPQTRLAPEIPSPPVIRQPR